MDRNTLFVSTTETFIVKGLEAKLKGIDTNPVHATPKIYELETKSADTELMILYTDETLCANTQVLVYLKDLCASKDVRMIVVGAKEEYEAVNNWIPLNYIQSFCERPLDIENFSMPLRSIFRRQTSRSGKRASLSWMMMCSI